MDYGVETPDHNYSHMIQSFHRFMIDTMSSEGNSYPHNPWLLPHSDADSGTNPTIHNPAPAPITQLCGVDAKNIIVCGHCGAVREKENMLHVIDLSYPRKVSATLNIDLACAVSHQFFSADYQRSDRFCVYPTIIAPSTDDAQSDLHELRKICHLRESSFNR